MSKLASSLVPPPIREPDRDYPGSLGPLPPVRPVSGAGLRSGFLGTAVVPVPRLSQGSPPHNERGACDAPAYIENVPPDVRAGYLQDRHHTLCLPGRHGGAFRFRVPPLTPWEILQLVRPHLVTSSHCGSSPSNYLALCSPVSLPSTTSSRPSGFCFSITPAMSPISARLAPCTRRVPPPPAC